MSGLQFISHIESARACGSIPIIAEIKVCSPSHGDLLNKRDVVSVAKEYQAGGAACISVVTGKWYCGSARYLEKVAACVAAPVLRKDFIINCKQIRESREMGASAVLLTKKILPTEQIEELALCALSHDMVPFIEVSNEQELKECTSFAGAILAINNKDIRTKETDTCDYRKGMQLLRDCKKGRLEALFVSASGITTDLQAAQLIDAGFDALLIGTSLMRSHNIEREIARFVNANRTGKRLSGVR